MVGSLHGSARTTPRLRAELQVSKDKEQRPGSALRVEPHDGKQVAKPSDDIRCSNGTFGTAQHCADARGRGHGD